MAGVYGGFGVKENDFEHGGELLGYIHAVANDKKYFCYFTGFLEGVVASKALEETEIEPLIAQCEDFVSNTGDPDAKEILEDFKAQLLEYQAIVDAIHFRAKEIDSTCPKSSANRFLGLCAGVACDGVITIEEVRTLVARAEEADLGQDDPHVQSLILTCIDALEDGIIDTVEQQAIATEIGRLVGDAYCDTGLAELGGVPLLAELNPDFNKESLEGQTIVLTGSFKTRPRKIFEDRLAAFGCEIAKSVTKKTDLVIIGGEPSRDWLQTHRGTKILKAIKLQKDTGKPKFLSEADLLKSIKTNT